MRILEPRLVCEQQVVHVPEPPLAARRLGRAGGGPGPRMARPDREVAEHPAKRQVPEPLTQDRAVRALEIGVLDHQWRGSGAPHVVIGAELRDGSRAQVGQAAACSRPSKIRLAPGSSVGDGAR